MGQHLSEPITTKETSGVANEDICSAISSMQGWRIGMEDCHSQHLKLDEDNETSFFAVFDGHGGINAAEYCSNHMHKKIVETEAYQQGDLVQACRDGFMACDNSMLNDEGMQGDLSGCTAVCVLINNNRIFCSNTGDSRAVLSVSGVSEELSHDHKPTDKIEMQRIIAAGGWVEGDRVNGSLAISRTMGDFVYKRDDSKSPEDQMITAFPDVVVRDITDDCEFVVIACDGIWDVMSSHEVVRFVRVRIRQQQPPEQICEELLDNCLAPDLQQGGLGTDNMTVILICLLQGKSYEDLGEKCKVHV